MRIIHVDKGFMDCKHSHLTITAKTEEDEKIIKDFHLYIINKMYENQRDDDYKDYEKSSAKSI